MLNNGADTAERMGVDPGDVFITTMPLFHTGGCVCCVIGSVSKAATQVLIEAFDPAIVLEMFGTYRGNAMVGVPTMLVAMLEHPAFATTDLSSVKAICSGGSTVPAPLVKRFEEKLGAPFTIVFGQTECSPVAAQTRTDDSVEDKADTIGLPLPNMETKIIDPNTGETVPIGTIGEFCTRGYHVMLGYFEMPDATAAAIDADGWLHTGDLCAMDARGYCTVEGRLKDMIIRGGENIYPRELEELLFRHPKVGEVAVIGVPTREVGRRGRGLHPPGARRRHRQGRTDRLHARLARPAQDAKALVRGRGVPADGLGQDPEIQAARSLDQGRDDGDLGRQPTGHARSAHRTFTRAPPAAPAVCLSFTTLQMFRGWNSSFDSTLGKAWLNLRRTGAGGSNVFKPIYFEPGGPRRENACGPFISGYVDVYI